MDQYLNKYAVCVNGILSQLLMLRGLRTRISAHRGWLSTAATCRASLPCSVSCSDRTMWLCLASTSREAGRSSATARWNADRRDVSRMSVAAPLPGTDRWMRLRHAYFRPKVVFSFKKTRSQTILLFLLVCFEKKDLADCQVAS